MADDKLRDDSQTTVEDKLSSAAATALAVGTGAALFLRATDGGRLGRGLERATRTVSYAMRQINSHSVDDWGRDEVRSVLGGIKKEWQDAGKEVNGILKLRDTAESGIGAIGEYFRLASNPMAEARKMAEATYVKRKLLDESFAKYADGNTAMQSRIENFVDDIYGHINEEGYVNLKPQDNFRDSSIPQDIASSIANRMRELQKQNTRGAEDFQQTVLEASMKLINPELMAKHYGSDIHKTFQQKMFDAATGTRAATFDDLIASLQKKETSTRDGFIYSADGKTQTNKSILSGLEEIKALLGKHNGVNSKESAAFGQIYVDSDFLRVDKNGKLFSMKETSNFWDKVMDFASDTLPGTLFDLRDKVSTNKAPVFDVIGAGSLDPIIARSIEKSTRSSLTHNYVTIYDTVSLVGKDGHLQHVKELDGSYLVSGTNSHMERMLKKMFGDAGIRESNSRLLNMSGLGRDATQSAWEEFKSIAQKFHDDSWEGTMVKRAISPEREIAVGDMLKGEFNKGLAEEYISDNRELNFFMKRNTYELSGKATRKIKETLQEKGMMKGMLVDLFDALDSTDDEMVSKMTGITGRSVESFNDFANKDLSILMSRLLKDRNGTMQMMKTKNSRSQFFDGFEYTSFHDTLRTEIGKEIFAEIASTAEGSKVNSALKVGDKGAGVVFSVLEDAGITRKDARGAKRLAVWSMLQMNNTLVSGAMKTSGSSAATKRLTEQIFAANSGSTRLHDETKQVIKDMIAENMDAFESAKLTRQGIVQPARYNKYIHVKKAISPLDLIRPMNDGTKAGVKDFVMQFFGGRNKAGHVTDATMVNYFFGSRLSDALNYGSRLGLGPQDMGSAQDIWKGLLFKRALPLAIGVTYFDYANDVFRELTGNSILGTIYQGVANVDMGIRTIGDATGISGVYANEKTVNPFLQYWFGQEPYQNAEDRRKWYANGYSPVRKGRGWWFGGVSEFRGGKIDYWAPNFLRAESSNYKDKSLYDGFLDKWSHSWLPTPTNPLSPLAALTDPYWLENKHYNDRPYPVSGPLFAEGTPWGFALNPTVGELIKPRVMMHQDRLDGTLVDSKALIERENMAVMHKAEEHYFRLKNGSMETLNFNAYGAPTPSDRVVTFAVRNGKVARVLANTYGNYTGGGMTPQEYEEISDSGLPGARGAESMTGDQGGDVSGDIPPVLLTKEAIGEEPISLSRQEKMLITANSGGVLSGVAREYLERSGGTKKILHSMNQEIINKAADHKGGGTFTPETMWSEQALFGDKMLGFNADADDLLGVSDTEDALKEASLIARNIGGIYGWMGGSALGVGRQSKHLADSNAMNGWQRSFWDMNIGGFGGETMEIVRRFIPEFKRRNEINPLMNEMPDWMPERFRFGDPYTSVPDGEGRLPGKGYESLNKLHADQFGQYGAFDRYKILADIAPTSPEYKVWRAIAKKTVVDKQQRDEMKEIAKRVRKQLSDHEFYDYKYLGRGVDKQNAIVEEVIDNNHFRIHGDKQIYRLSGVRVVNDKKNNPTLKRYLHPGQEIVLGVDENPNYRQDGDSKKSINASVNVGGESLNEMLLEKGLAKIRKGDTSATAVQMHLGGFRVMEGKAWEYLAHLDIPFWSDKVARIRSPLESYKAEQVYGTPYQSWDHPIDSYLLPAFERAFATSSIAGSVAWYAHHYVGGLNGTPAPLRRAVDLAYILTNRGAFTGYVLGKIIKSNDSNLAHKLAGAGFFIQKLGHTLVNSDQISVTTTSGMAMGAYLGNILGKFPGKLSRAGAATGTIVGGILGALFGAEEKGLLSGVIDPEKRDVWIPERTRKKWEIEEYFDRLRYVKYMGLYEKAARDAKDKEGVDVKEILDAYDRQTEKRKEIKDELTKAKAAIKAEMQDGDVERKTIVSAINQKLQHLADSSLIMKGGDYTHAAIMYKEAADSTAYGQKGGATYVDTLRALPKQDRDYFMEMVKEKDPDKRQEILKYASPALRRALARSWGIKMAEQESNEQYFAKHELPGVFWAGWRPDVDLRNVEVKTINNEGMMLSDMGYYSTQLEEPGVINAPQASPFNDSNALTMRASLIGELKGLGLTGVDVRIEPNDNVDGIQAVFNAIRKTQAKIQEKVNDAFSF